jgi:hypothetical protein
MKKLGMLVLALGSMGSLGILGAGCGSGGGGGAGVVSHPLEGASQVDIPAGGCIIVNVNPETIPVPSTVSYNLVDQYGDDNYEVGVVPSNYSCQFSTYQSYVDDTFTGSFNAPPAAVPAGTFDLDVICQNALADCLLTSITWEATY